MVRDQVKKKIRSSFKTLLVIMEKSRDICDLQSRRDKRIHAPVS
jgi:hypothetical protein